MKIVPRIIKGVLLFILFGVCAIYTQKYSRKATDGFQIIKIKTDLIHDPRWDPPPLSTQKETEIKAILNQRYHYLAKGAQCYAFASEDGKWVLKFFCHHHLRPSFLESLHKDKTRKKRTKLEKDFMSYMIAYQELAEQTGLIYLHLNKTDHLNQKITIIDKIHIAHDLNLDEMEFILQRKATLVYPTIDEWMAEGNTEAAKAGLTSLVKLLKRRFDKKIFDKDPNLDSNFGFIGTEAIQIDVGRFTWQWSKYPQSEWKSAIERITDNLHQYLEARYPPLSEHLKEEVALL